jgi:hypothetical protein
MWRGMVIVSEWQTNYATLDLNPQAQDDSKAFVGSAGCYFPSEDLRLDADIRDLASKGVIQFAPAPPYASQAYYSLLIEALRVKDILDKPNNTMQTASTVNNKNLQPSYGQAYATASSIGKKYAEWLYWMNQYKGNTANVTGKLRFDIGPGSFVSSDDAVCS